MKKQTLVAMLLLAILLIASSCDSYDSYDWYNMRWIGWVGEFVYDEDFTVTYESTLNAMFGDTWTVISVEERFNKGEEPRGSSIPGINPHTYLLTTIEFLDGNGDVRTFQFNNRGSFARRIEHYITSTWIVDYYWDNFIDVYFQDIPLGIGTYVFAFLARATTNLHLLENHEFNRATREYRQLLSTPEGAPRLNEMTPANVFEMFPMYLSVSIRLDGETAHPPEVEESIFNQVDNMIDSMIAYTNNTLNAIFFISYQQHIDFYSDRSRWKVIQGERVDFSDIDRRIFENFKGILW